MYIHKRIFVVGIIALFLCVVRVVYAATIGSDTAVTRFNTTQTLNNTDRVAGFAALAAGFTLSSSAVNATFDSFFPVEGPVRFNAGTLTLNQDLVFHNNTIIYSIGSINAQGHALEFNCSSTVIPAISVGSASCSTWSNVCFVLNQDLILNGRCILFDGICGIDGRGHSLTLTEGSNIYVNTGSSLSMENITIKGVTDNIIGAFDNLVTVSLNNVEWVLSGNYTFTKGNLDIVGEFNVIGDGFTFAYTSNGASKIEANGTLYLDHGVTFSYAPVTANNGLLQLMDNTSEIYLNGATLFATTAGLLLTKGKLLVDRASSIRSDAIIQSQAVQFGDGISSGNNLNVQILPAAVLNVVNGFVALNDV